MRRMILLAFLIAAPLFALGAQPASACWGWGYGSGYGYSSYRPAYRYAYAGWGWRGWGWRRGWRRW